MGRVLPLRQFDRVAQIFRGLHSKRERLDEAQPGQIEAHFHNISCAGYAILESNLSKIWTTNTSCPGQADGYSSAFAPAIRVHDRLPHPVARVHDWDSLVHR